MDVTKFALVRSFSPSIWGSTSSRCRPTNRRISCFVADDARCRRSATPKMWQTPPQQQQQQQSCFKARHPYHQSTVCLHLSTQSGDDDGASSTSSTTSIPKQRILFLGTPDVAATTLQTLYDAARQSCQESSSLSSLSNIPFEIAAVVTQPTKRRKRSGRSDEQSPVGVVAQQLGLPLLLPEKANEASFLDALHEYNIDLCITAAYGQYLPKRFLSTPRCGTVNIHPSLLPKWRGAAPVQRSIEAGDATVAVTVLYTVSKMDAGPIIAQQTLELDKHSNETTTTLLPRLFDMGTQLLLQYLPSIFNGTMTMDTATVQDEAQVVTADKIDATEAELKVWTESATTCHNRVRAFSVWPQTYLWLSIEKEGQDVQVLQVKVLQTRVVADVQVPNVERSNIIRLGPTKQSGLYVTCHDGSILELVTVQPATRKAFAARDLHNGYPGCTLRWIIQHEPVSATPVQQTDKKATIDA